MIEGKMPETIWAYSNTGRDGVEGQWKIYTSNAYGVMPEYIRKDISQGEIDKLKETLKMLRGQYSLFVGPDDAIANTVLSIVDKALKD